PSARRLEVRFQRTFRADRWTGDQVQVHPGLTLETEDGGDCIFLGPTDDQTRDDVRDPHRQAGVSAAAAGATWPVPSGAAAVWAAPMLLPGSGGAADRFPSRREIPEAGWPGKSGNNARRCWCPFGQERLPPGRNSLPAGWEGSSGYFCSATRRRP